MAYSIRAPRLGFATGVCCLLVAAGFFGAGAGTGDFGYLAGGAVAFAVGSHLTSSCPLCADCEECESAAGS